MRVVLILALMSCAYTARAEAIISFEGTGIHEQFSAGANITTSPYAIQFTLTLTDFPISMSNPFGVICSGIDGCPDGAAVTWLRGPGSLSDVLFFVPPDSNTGFYSFNFPTGTFTSFGGPTMSSSGDIGAITITTTPEPPTLAAVILGLVIVCATKRRLCASGHSLGRASPGRPAA